MAFLGCSCKKELKSGRATGVGRLKAKTSIGLSVLSQLSATSNIRENASKDHANRITLAGVGSLAAKETQDHTPSTTNKLTGEGSIASKMTLNVKMRANISGDSDLTQTFADKFSGDFDKMPSGFLSTQKLYPIADAVNNGFIDESKSSDFAFNRDQTPNCARLNVSVSFTTFLLSIDPHTFLRETPS